MEGVHVVGSRARESGGVSGGRKYPRWIQGKAPVKGLEDGIPQKLKQNVKLVYNFNVFLYKI